MNKPKFYTPREAAEKLGISVRMLQYFRRTGRIKGIAVGNMTLYTDEQIANARLGRLRSGPKSSKPDQEADWVYTISR